MFFFDTRWIPSLIITMVLGINTKLRRRRRKDWDWYKRGMKLSNEELVPVPYPCSNGFLCPFHFISIPTIGILEIRYPHNFGTDPNNNLGRQRFSHLEIQNAPQISLFHWYVSQRSYRRVVDSPTPLVMLIIDTMNSPIFRCSIGSSNYIRIHLYE